MPESVKVIDPQFRVVYANGASLKNMETGLNDVRGRFCHQAFYGYKEKCFFCGMSRVFEMGQPQVSYCTLSLHGSNRDYEVSTFPLFDTNRKVQYAVEIVRDITPLSKGAPLPQSAGKISSRDKTFGLVFEQMAQWAEDDQPVLLQGEKGTGKKSFARALHQRSHRASGPFRVFHCVDNAKGECAEGLFGAEGAWAKAKGGTLYLDGICHLGEASQKMFAEKLSKPSPEDPRVVAATPLDVLSLVHQEILRLDFYNRFASRVLRLPALRDRKQDLPFLAQHFIETYRVLTGSPAEKLGPDALCQLMAYSWPGNIRELETQMERACLMAKGPQIERLDVELGAPGKAEKLDDLIHQTEKTYLVDLLAKNHGRLAETAQQAGLSLKTLQRKMKKYELKSEDFRHLS
ncbi:MAG TPA: sigma 54-interacting transcriptional regulator [bacterium]|nr:sigma 54-interacting transcriptional regulator [bacterium]